MIQTPKLDDRTYADIVAEAMRLIPRYCPEWTNHNPSDPGITLLELCAWMTELILARLNRVPEKNYLAFLDMMGVKLRPAQPARALLTFDLVEGIERQVLRKGLQVATSQTGGGDEEEALLFETSRDLTVVSAKIDRCFSYFDETYSDNSTWLSGELPEGFPAFAGAERVDRFIYLGDDRLETLSDSAVLRLHIAAPEGGRDIARLLEWEYFNGRRWRPLTQAQYEVDRGEVIFKGPQDLQRYRLQSRELTKYPDNALDTFFLRGRLAEVPSSEQETQVDTIRGVIEVVGEGLVPDVAFSNPAANTYIALDLGKNIHPFGNEPRPDHCLYIASQEVFSQGNADIELAFGLSDPQVVPPPVASDELVLSWEYFDGKKWRILGKTTPRGKAPQGYEHSDHAFIDGTNCFTKSGSVTFRRPKELSPGEINGEANYWIRVRVERGDYGITGAYMLDGDRWVWRDERPLRPPALASIAMRYRTDLSHLTYFVSYNDFRYRDHSDDAKKEYEPFQPFQSIPDEGAALYMGWNGRLPNETISVYFQMLESSALELDYKHSQHLQAYYARRDKLWDAEQRVVWEYFDGKRWTRLAVTDGTRNFTKSGFVDFLAPDDFEKTLKFTEDRYWIRARLEMGGYIKPPRVRRVLQNTVEAGNSRTIERELLGSSDGSPLQRFTLLHGPLLEGAVIEVRERDEPKPEEIVDLGPEAVLKSDDKEGGYWVRWREVESFFESGPKSRHYICDPQTRQIHFGDGTRGLVPPQMKNSVRARSYSIGGGVRGNVNAGQLTTVTRAVAHIEKVTNVLPAEGGADPETIEMAKERAPRELKTRNRAVTVEDFESLAKSSSTSVARARCLPSEEKSGHVQVLLVPQADMKNLDLKRKLSPPPELCRFVKNYLDERRLITTIVDVAKPTYVEISLKVVLIRRTVGQSDWLRAQIEDRLRRYLHPLLGGKEGKGWPFGMPVYRTDLVHLVEDIPGVEAIDSITIYDEDRRVRVENVRLRSNELPHVVRVEVIERVRQEMI